MAETDWSEKFSLPSTDGKWSEKNRENILQVNDPAILEEQIMDGRVHALSYPVETTELLIPYESIKKFMDSDTDSKIRKYIYRIGKSAVPFKTMKELYKWIGLTNLPENTQQQGPNPIPLSRVNKDFPMGASFFTKNNAIGLTFSCAACHSQDLFGTKILGLTNRFPRANELFRMGKTAFQLTSPNVYAAIFNASYGDKEMVRHDRHILNWVGVKEPQVLGLDTSLAQVGISLGKREKDAYATKTLKSLITSGKHPLEKMVADSKPAVWWNLKYKTRWLSDGSVVSGNPIYTNFLWNEIGRGADLEKLEKWLLENQDVVEELTSAVFATKAPSITDFYDPQKIDIEKAKRGEKYFNDTCMKCHGTYIKKWSDPSANELSYVEQLETKKVIYHAKTPVFNVGTDPGRYKGMETFADDLNRLEISKKLKTVIRPQKGYVPPPLVGIWSRWPYFHNNSIPNLCALLTEPQFRPKKFFMGEATDKATDFDFKCVGYPVKEVPAKWKREQLIYDTTKEGLSNAGHFKMLQNEDGSEKYLWEQKLEIIEFLKTL